jgi:DNA-binding response OmpR family regulator
MTAYTVLYVRSRSGSSTLSAKLSSEGFQVHYLRRVDLLWHYCTAQAKPFEILIAEADAIAALRALPTSARPPITLVLTTQSDESLNGAFVLPTDTHPDELLARLRALLRRRLGYPTHYRTGPLGIDLLRGKASLNGCPLDLHPRELRILALLASHHERAVHTAQIAAVLNPDGSPCPSLVPTYICHLRRRLGPRFIETVPGIGYRLTPPEQPRT